MFCAVIAAVVLAGYFEPSPAPAQSKVLELLNEAEEPQRKPTPLPSPKVYRLIQVFADGTSSRLNGDLESLPIKPGTKGAEAVVEMIKEKESGAKDALPRLLNVGWQVVSVTATNAAGGPVALVTIAK